jgi:hypothetical protein
MMPSRLSGSIRVTPQEARPACRFARFLQGADELFTELGFDATTLQTIAKRAGYSIGALNNRLPEKQSVAAYCGPCRCHQDENARRGRSHGCGPTALPAKNG